MTNPLFKSDYRKTGFFLLALNQISNKIKKAIEKDLSRSGMGTTLSAIYLTENKLNTIHVGDSRIYLIRDKKLQMISKDQTYIESSERWKTDKRGYRDWIAQNGVSLVERLKRDIYNSK